ncbi:DUF7262 family protein [Haloferax larsenii]|uniref:Uncharacterized protein n=1 Tax=Haloferax larsenii TaxID=302484 RepID=A0A1H7GDY4_HALLR|nr:hypothetical protein [Haloferax larsenii]SEK34015.1 hypothetical protein SAMN04488691_101236 [Haloferax larsenii]
MRERGFSSPSGEGESRGQLSLTVIEAAIATLLVLTVAAGFALTPEYPTATLDHSSTPLDEQAHDAAALVAAAPADGPGTLLGAACASESDFDARAAQLRTVATSGVSPGAFVSIQTDVGKAGTSPPADARVGSASVVVPRCTATLEVWYP